MSCLILFLMNVSNYSTEFHCIIILNWLRGINLSLIYLLWTCEGKGFDILRCPIVTRSLNEITEITGNNYYLVVSVKQHSNEILQQLLGFHVLLISMTNKADKKVNEPLTISLNLTRKWNSMWNHRKQSLTDSSWECLTQPIMMDTVERFRNSEPKQWIIQWTRLELEEKKTIPWKKEVNQKWNQFKRRWKFKEPLRLSWLRPNYSRHFSRSESKCRDVTEADASIIGFRLPWETKDCREWLLMLISFRSSKEEHWLWREKQTRKEEVGKDLVTHIIQDKTSTMLMKKTSFLTPHALYS